MEFTDIDTNRDLQKPVEGTLKITLGKNIPHSVYIGIKDEEDDRNASYVEFKRRSQTVEKPNKYPVIFHFTTYPSRKKGGKLYFYRTADWEPDSDLSAKQDSEYVEHHTPGIPSAQRIRLIHRILEGEAGDETMYELMDFYDKGRTDASSRFSDDIKQYVGFKSRAKIQDFLSGHSGFSRSHSEIVNKLTKQLKKKKYRHRATSLEDVEIMVATVNELENFPSTTVEEVFERLVEQVENPEKLNEIANHLGMDDWSAVFSP